MVGVTTPEPAEAPDGADRAESSFDYLPGDKQLPSPYYSDELVNYAPAGCVELDGVLYCVAHDGIIDELSARTDRDGNVVCDQWDEYDDLCRMVPLFIRVTEDLDAAYCRMDDMEGYNDV